MPDILHIDLNNFYASVACLEQPQLKQLPLAVCGSQQERHGIVLAKNEVAKTLGVKTGEAIWQAKTKAPHLIIVEPNFSQYYFFSQKARLIYSDYTNQVEPFGIDEAWLDVTGSKNLFGQPLEIAEIIRQRVKQELGLTVSIGVSFNKVFAKLASDLKKPDAISHITPENFQDVVWPLPIENLLYVGKATATKLRLFGIDTIGKLAKLDKNFLQTKLGKWGPMLWVYANGLDKTVVSKISDEKLIKSLGNSTTCARDLHNANEVKLVFATLAESIALRLRENKLKAQALQISVRDNNLDYWHKQITFTTATDHSEQLLFLAMQLFNESYSWSNPIRSLGLRCINLVNLAQTCEQLSLFATTQQTNDKQARIVAISDQIRAKFGYNSITKASTLLDQQLTHYQEDDLHYRQHNSFHSR